MSAACGLSVGPDLENEFRNACESDAGFLKISISEKGEDFEIADRCGRADDPAEDWKNVREVLDIRVPCNVLLRLQDSDKWVLVAWVPPRADSKLKMMYASSRESLKAGLGKQLFVEDYFVATRDDCTLAEYIDSVAPERLSLEMKTWQEKMMMKAAIDSAPTSVKQSVLATLDIPLTSAALEGINSFKEGSVNFVLFRLIEGSESLDVEDFSVIDVDQVQEKLSALPRFVLYRYDHSRDGANESKIVYIYYCPDACKPKQKMFYSTCVKNITELCEQNGIEIDRKFEISIPSEASPEAIEVELYPKTHKKEKFALPVAPGRRARSRDPRKRK